MTFAELDAQVKALGVAGDHRGALFQAMTAPIQQSFMHQNVGRRLLLMDELPKPLPPSLEEFVRAQTRGDVSGMLEYGTPEAWSAWGCGCATPP